MAQSIIRNVLESCYGDSPELRFFMRPDNRFAQHLIARQVLKHYVQIDAEIDQILPTRRVCPGGRQVLFRAIISDIEEELEHLSLIHI